MQTIVSSRKQGASLIRTVMVVAAGSENSPFNPRFAQGQIFDGVATRSRGIMMEKRSPENCMGRTPRTCPR